MECEQQFSLSWNNFHGNVSRELSALLGSGALADVTLAVGGELLQAHRLVLAICSPYFKKMFQSNPHHHPIVVLRDVTFKAMRDLLQFMYHGEVSVKREDLTGFIATAELLQIKGLTNKEFDDDIRENEIIEQSSQEVAKTTKRSSDNDSISEDVSPQVEMKRKSLNEKIQRLNQLKRTSEQFLQNFYQTELPEKRLKPEEKQPNHVIQNASPIVPFYPESQTNVPYNDAKKNNLDCENKDSYVLDLKTECDDSDIVVMDDPGKSFDESPGEHTLSKDVPVPHEDASSLRSIFMDLKSIVNGKFACRAPIFEDFSSKEHLLTTIPQKTDGKKKYPQRSCRACGKLGRRKDTRFMCSLCGIPFCKSPCFEMHLRKVSSKIDNEYSLVPF